MTTAQYAAVPANAAPDIFSESSDDEGSCADHEVLKEEEEREKLLAGGNGLFGSIGGKSGVKIGKKVRGARGKKKGVHDVVQMMGGKRLGMEEGGEFGLGANSGDEADSEDGEEVDLLMEKEVFERKPRKPTVRRVLLYTVSLLTFLLLLISASLSLSYGRHPRTAPVRIAKDTRLSNGTHDYKPTTLLISLDGFRADFLDRSVSPQLTAIAHSGLSPRWLTPAFPSVTFPNHWTIVTGLYPESHGIVGNSFWDPAFEKEFFYTDPARSMQGEWWGGEPLWVTAERQGVKSAVHMWPGSEANGGWNISYLDHFNGTESLKKKTARILDWLDLPLPDRPQFIAAYVPNIDVVGHKFGPNTTELDLVVREVDSMLTDLLGGLDARNLTDIINIVIVSDHGMASTSHERLVYIDEIIDMSLIEHTDGWPLYGLRPHADVNITALYESLLAETLTDETKGKKHWDVYLRDKNMPARWHFSNNDRIAPLWVVPETGYAIVTREEYDVDAPFSGRYEPAGLHGYDNLHPLMRAIFVAKGPAFRHMYEKGRGNVMSVDEENMGVLVEEFGNWEVHKIVCESLGISEALGGTNATIKDLSAFKVVNDWLVAEDEKEEEETDSSEPTATDTIPTSANEGIVSIQTVPSDPNPPQPNPETTPSPEQKEPPAAENPSEGEEEKPEEKKPEDMNPWEYAKWKAEKLRIALEKWWEGVWVGDDD
ncbi:Phosphodiest-domain-containing protein [Choiromyces venosus 120613-1]|uniref:Phosphodiest-domain-containing protein n=1 Tax=Choiromyces venosus 120613-1 TaxID=1336337 RepID=A0A3N4JX78_9PEZI|nr:Phosphodiest-domain-containing protein [Choiromyces venosus 120613-1]